MQAYTKTDQQFHWLSQTLAKTNRSFVSKKTDDSHTNLYFDPLGNRIYGRWIKTLKGKLILTLNIDTLQFEWLGSSYHTLKSFHSVGKKIEAVEQEIAVYLTELGLNPKGFTDKLHYDIPEYPFAKNVIRQLNEPETKQWKNYRDLANQACAHLLDYLQIEGEIRIWPHHFDTGIYVVTDKGIGIGFGMAMEDSHLNDPYFYMSGYSSGRSIAYKNLPGLSMGKWINAETLKGAVLPLSELDQISETNRIETLDRFILIAANWFVNHQ